MIGQIIQSVASRAGYEIRAAWRVPALAHARKLQEIFRHFDIETVLDVGANAGQFRDFLRLQVGFCGEIHSFEPIAALAEKLDQRAASDPLWSVHALALGPEAGRREINVMNSTVFSSFLQPLHEGVPEFTTLNTIARTEAVTVQTLDAVLESTLRSVNLERTFLKLDTQGFDLEVLKGARRSAARFPALQTEVSVRRIYNGMPDMAQSIAAFGEAGFSVSDFFIVAENGRFEATEFDCLMVRNTR